MGSDGAGEDADCAALWCAEAQGDVEKEFGDFELAWSGLVTGEMQDAVGWQRDGGMWDFGRNRVLVFCVDF